MNENNPRKKVSVFWLFGAIIVMLAFGALIMFRYLSTEIEKQQSNPNRPRVAGGVKNMSFTEKSGDIVALHDLQGKIWLATYVYTSCPDACIGMSAKLRELKNYFEKNNLPISIVSVSLDPDNDSPEQLRNFASAHGLNHKNWWHLTGGDKKMRKLMVDTFQFSAPVAVTDPAEKAKYGPYVHDARIALVDQNLQIRGKLYDLMSPQDFVAKADEDRLKKDVEYLYKNPPTE